jgi:hypothetical protein
VKFEAFPQGFGPVVLVALVATDTAAKAAIVPTTFSVFVSGSDVASLVLATCLCVYAVHSGWVLTAATGLALQTILSEAVLANAGRLTANAPSEKTHAFHCITDPLR